MHYLNPHQLRMTRRSFLGKTTTGIGSLALASLLNPTLLSAAETVAQSKKAQLDKWMGTINPRHFAPRAKRIIYLYMAGGPSHLETFDHKPKLTEMSGQPMPDSFTKGQPIAQLQNQQLKCFEPQFKF